MKKLFFAVIAATFVFVSANNAFASNKMISTSAYEPTDTVAPADTTETTTETPAPADTTNTPADSTAEQAQ